MNMTVKLGPLGFPTVDVGMPTPAENWAPYRDGFHAAEMADRYSEALIRIQWRGWNERKGERCCPLCQAPEKGRVHFGSCLIGQALKDCPGCEGSPLPDHAAQNGRSEYTMDVPTTCSVCERCDSDYEARPL